MFVIYPEYVRQLDGSLDRIRAKYLGQLRPLTELVPNESKLSADRFSDQLAQVLTIQISRVRRLNDREICDSWRWFRVGTRFLLDGCNREDRTLWSLVRLAKLESATLEYMDLSAIPKHDRKAFTRVPPCIRDHLEEAVWLLEEPRDLTELRV